MTRPLCERGIMPRLHSTQLDLSRCPHCNVDTPTLAYKAELVTVDFRGTNKRAWRFYVCSRCGGMVTAAALAFDHEVIEIYPRGSDIDPAIPDRAREYLHQAISSLSSPAGAVMLAASAV